MVAGFTVWAPVMIISVWPSGGAWATTSLPTMPLAPALFSTITVCFHRSVSLGPTSRATMSVPPPGG